MKNARKWLMMLLVCVLAVSFSGLTSADSDKKSAASKEGRTPFALEFNDIKDAQWAASYITKMRSKNVLQGFEDGSFRPNQPVTRVEAIVMAVRLLGLEEEAKSKAQDAKLHFKDANLIDKKYSWAKGYIQVALENGLFDASENTVQPDKPASRVWIAGLLVKSLGLQTEALHEMSKAPAFKDAGQIPAGSVGYVNVAVEQGIISGYPDGTFKPNKNVTRAEVAALLDRTNGGLLDQSGAVKVKGAITSIVFKTSDSGKANNGNPSTVGKSTYDSVDGAVTITTDGKDSYTYGISSELLVSYYDKFVRADQLAVDDSVQLVVLDKIVKEAALLNAKQDEDPKDPETKPEEPSKVTIREMELEVKLADKGKIELEYENKHGQIKAEFEIESNKDKQELKGQPAVAVIEKLIADAAITDQMDKDEIVNKVLSALKLEKESLQQLELEIKFSNGKEIKVEQKQKQNKDENKDKKNENEKGKDKGKGNDKNKDKDGDHGRGHGNGHDRDDH